jgi:pimeloyl-ACP methyl ester carboxylesterase
MRRVQAGADFKQRIQPPTLILWGEQDIALDFSGATDSLKWTDDGRLVSYPQASHWVQEDVPEAVNTEMLHFLVSE